jgi:hypothetical protein
MSSISILLLILSCISIVMIGIQATKNIPKSLMLLLISLPLLNLVRKAFSAPNYPFPTAETGAVFLVLLLANLSFRKIARHSSNLARWGMTLLTLITWFAFASTLCTSDWGKSGKIMLAGIIAPWVCYYLASSAVKTLEDSRHIVFGLLSMGILSGIYSLLNMKNLAGISGGMVDANTLIWMYNEAPIVNFYVVPSSAVAATIPIIPLSFWYWKYGRILRIPIASTAIISCAIISLLSLSRGSWIALAGTLFFSYMILLRNYKGIHITSMIVVVMALFIYYNYAPFISMVLDSRITGDPFVIDNNILSRYDNYLLVLQSWYHYLIIGTGLGNYPAIYTDLKIQNIEYLVFAHNIFLTLIVEIGFLGACFYLIFYLVHIVAAFKFKCVSQAEGDLNCAIGMGLLATILIASTSGCHIVPYITKSSELTYFTAPVMIVAFTLMGVVARSHSSPGVTKLSTRNDSINI